MLANVEEISGSRLSLTPPEKYQLFYTVSYIVCGNNSQSWFINDVSAHRNIKLKGRRYGFVFTKGHCAYHQTNIK